VTAFPIAGAPAGTSPRRPDEDRAAHARVETAIAGVLFVFASAAFAARVRGRVDAATAAGALLVFASLTAATLSLSIGACRAWLRSLHLSPIGHLLAAPAVLTLVVATYSLIAGLPPASRTIAFGVYLFVPAAILGARPGSEPAPWQILAVAAVMWLPIEFNVLPSLPLPPTGGLRAAPLVALPNGLYMFLVACDLDRVGYSFRLRRHDLVLALLATAVFAVIAIPIGLGTGFLRWGPRLSVTSTIVTPLAIYLVTGVPEEFLFRGLIQNALERWIGAAGLPVAATIFGFAHLPDPRYVVLAAIAGIAYGWVYARTRAITASAVTHALVDWIWVLLLRG
jgi:membrane protease YdiL (CAAX protease family)